MPDIVTILTSITALMGGFWLLRALVGPIRGKPMPTSLLTRIQQALTGLSAMAIALFVAAPVGYFGAWFLTLGLGALIALARPDWMVRGRAPSRVHGLLIYLGLAAIMVVLGTLIDGPEPAFAEMTDGWLVDVAALATLLAARNWLWFWRKNAPFAHLTDPRAAADAEAARGGSAPGSTKDMAWWDRAWTRRMADPPDGATAADAALDDLEDSAPPEGSSPRQAADTPTSADETLRVPGYDPALLAEELATFRNHTRTIDRVALTWPDHPVAEALIHVSVILNETRQYLQDNPDKYRELRPILVGHASTAADIAGLVQRIKGTGETLDDAEGVAQRLFALAGLMRETRRKSTQVERDRLQASMAVIDEELNALSAMRDFRARVARESKVS